MIVPRDLFEDPQSTIFQGLLGSELLVVNDDPLIIVAIVYISLHANYVVALYLRSTVFASVDLNPFLSVLGHTVSNHNTEGREDRLRLNQVPQATVHNIVGSLHNGQTTVHRINGSCHDKYNFNTYLSVI
jgi:hypothetical protein